MNSFKLVTITLAFAATLLSGASSVGAQTSGFTSCLTPSGEILANYDTGSHGIAGLGSKIGKDTVYTASNGNAMQCFCGENGEGIQTNWMKVGNLSTDEIKVHESQGWIYIPTGATWGLDDEPYLAQNINFSCGGSSTTSGGDGRTDGRTDGRSDGLGSIVQAAHGTSLASTGNILFIAEVFTAGVLMTLAGLFMRRKAN